MDKNVVTINAPRGSFGYVLLRGFTWNDSIRVTDTSQPRSQSFAEDRLSIDSSLQLEQPFERIQPSPTIQRQKHSFIYVKAKADPVIVIYFCRIDTIASIGAPPEGFRRDIVVMQLDRCLRSVVASEARDDRALFSQLN